MNTKSLLKVFSLAVVFVTSTPVTFAASDWSLATNAAPWAARESHGLVVHDGKMWILGGLINGSFANDVWYSTDGTNWVMATGSAAWSQRAPMSVTFGGQMWVVGGACWGARCARNDVWSSTDGATWQQATAAATWSTREYSGLVVFKNKMWLLGGIASEAGNWVYRNDVYTSTDGTTWSQVTDAAPWIGRGGLAAVSAEQKIWIFGGWNAGVAMNDVWYSTNGTNWVQATSAAQWDARGGVGSVASNGYLWLFGGQSVSGLKNDVWVSADGANWRLTSGDNLWSPRLGPGSALFGGKTWLVGGGTVFNNVGSFMNDAWFSSEAEPLVFLKKAVKPSFSSLSVGKNYQLQVSPDLNTWTNSGSPFTATNAVMDYPLYWDVDNWSQLSFRLQGAP